MNSLPALFFTIPIIFSALLLGMVAYVNTGFHYMSFAAITFLNAAEVKQPMLSLTIVLEVTKGPSISFAKNLICSDCLGLCNIAEVPYSSGMRHKI